MPSPIEILESALIDLRAKHENEIQDILSAIEHLRAGNLEPKPLIPEIKEGRYVGQKVAFAIESYLRECGYGAVPLEQVVEALRLGGCALTSSDDQNEWQPERYVHNFKITLSNNAKRFSYDEDRGTIRLIVR